MPDAVRVITRIRPLQESDDYHCCVPGVSGNSVILKTSDGDREYSNDIVFGSSSDQRDVFGCIGPDVIDCLFDGRNASVIAYGQTGSGKTHTMIGSKKNPGIIPNLLNNILANCTEGCSVHIRAVQVYNELVLDLFDCAPSNKRLPLKLREVMKGVFVPESATRKLLLPGQAFEILSKTSQNREVAKTNMNTNSSRSHTVYMIDLAQEAPELCGELISTLYLVDLAGSENANRSGVTGPRLQETSNINRSLAALKGVMGALAAGETFTPYRDSVLTKLLKDCMGGNAKTTLLCCVSSSKDDEIETRSTLEFGLLSQKVTTFVSRNIRKSYPQLKNEIDLVQSILLNLRSDISVLENKLPTECNTIRGIPRTFICPLTSALTPNVTVMKDPVIASNGKTYESEALKRKWLRSDSKGDIKPVAGILNLPDPVTDMLFFKNKNCCSQIATWRIERLWPSDVLRLVLEYSTPEITLASRLVCSTWERGTKEEEFWSTILQRDYRNYPPPSNTKLGWKSWMRQYFRACGSRPKSSAGTGRSTVFGLRLAAP